MEVRLIDELTLQRELFVQTQKNAIDLGSCHYDSYKNWCLSGLEVEKTISDIFSETGFFCPAIDSEILPIVQELKKQLEQVTKERDSAIKYLKVAVGETGNCYGCKWWDEETGKCKNEIAEYECDIDTNDMWEWKGV